MSDTSDSERSDSEQSEEQDTAPEQKVYYTDVDGTKKELPDGMIPPRLQEPVFIKKKTDDEKKKIAETERKIDFNKPKDQMVLIEDKPVEELEEAEELLAKYENPADDFFGFRKTKKTPTVTLKDWELGYKDLFEPGTIPILNFSSVSEIENFGKASTIINSFRKHCKETIVTYSGGFSNSGGYTATSFKGRHLIHLLTQLKVDFIGLNIEDLQNPELTSRILEFSGTVVNSNLKMLNGGKISGIYNYVIRKVSGLRICFVGVIFEGCAKYKFIDPRAEIDDLLEDQLKGKYDLTVLFSSKNIGFSGVNLILGCSTGINSQSIIGKVPIICSDINLISMSVSLIDKKQKCVKTQILETEGIPEDKGFGMHLKYWRDLGSGELKSKYGLEISRSLGNMRINGQKVIFQALRKYNTEQKLDLGYLLLQKEMKLRLSEDSKVYHLFKRYPEDLKFVKIAVNDAKILSQILGDSRIRYTMVVENNIICCTESVAREIIADYLDEISAIVLEDIKVILGGYFL